MADLNDRGFAQVQSTSARTSAAEIDEGLRSYMLMVYNYMAMALGVTGAAALGTFYLSVTNDPTAAAAQLPNGEYLTQLGYTLFATPLKYVVFFAPLGLVFFLSARIQKMKVSTAQTTFWIYAGLVGISLASIFMVYTHGSIARVFFITAAAFGGLSLYGYTTKKDLTGWGSFLFMGLIGIIIAMVVNIFLESSALQFAISVIGVLVFAGLTAYDTQQIKNMYAESDGTSTATRKAILGALKLYLDFINLFIMMLMLFGNRE